MTLRVLSIWHKVLLPGDAITIGLPILCHISYSVLVLVYIPILSYIKYLLLLLFLSSFRVNTP